MSEKGSQAQGGGPWKVLIVDDNVQNLELLEAYMDELPEVVPTTATNGIDAIDKVMADPPDLILLDIMMPKMSGFEVCKHLKADPETRDIPIIMVTALNELGDMERARECGTDEFLSKPVNRVELATRVRNLLRLRGLKKELEQSSNKDRGLGAADVEGGGE
ncbi:MAG: response regulator [Phycisphaerae bacterium]|nr:response regulator [Phycisphaerae bacterium]